MTEDPARFPSAPAERDGFLRRLVLAVLVTALAGVLLALLILGYDILLAAFGGILFAILLRTLTGLLTRITPLSDGFALTIVLLLGTALLVGSGWLLAPQIGAETEGFGQQVETIAVDVEEFLQQHGWGRWILEQVQEAGGDGAAEGAMAALGSIFGTASIWSTYLLTGFFVGLFAAANPRLYLSGSVSLFPLRHRERVDEIFCRLGRALRWWLIGQAIAMVMIGVSTWLVLWAFGVPLAPVLGVIVGLLGFIPYLGPILGAIPVALVAATMGTTTLLYVFLAYTAVQMVEGYVITPLIQHRMVYLPPVFTIITQILLGTLMGILGFVLATPLAAVVLVLSRYYRADVLGDHEALEKNR
ncbi:AI-2E family transporter [soil metagenome]